MARPRFFRRSGDAQAPKPPVLRRPAPGVLRRERGTLDRLHEQRLRDLGGLLLEMYRRGTFREELLSEQCADLVAIETRLGEIEALLTTPRRHTPRCTCGTPILPGSHFCPGCGRQLVRPGSAATDAGDETMIEPPPAPGEETG
ncbi:MAG TPA: hypothetical protein VFI37_07185 [Gaiellaceae bacterium]|jgi:hypothetical protein|nr:hypothetical protein [Gaiellaceae bacterium]